MKEKILSMTVLDVRVFLSLHQTKSCSRTAREVEISQPKVSRCLKNLRDIFGDELFEKLPSGMCPTSLSKAILSDISTLSGELDSLFSNDCSGIVHCCELTICCREHMHEYFDKVISRECALRKKRCYLTFVPWSRCAIQNLKDNKIDISISSEEDDHDINSITLDTARHCFIIKKKGRSLGRQPLKRALAVNPMLFNFPKEYLEHPMVDCAKRAGVEEFSHDTYSNMDYMVESVVELDRVAINNSFFAIIPYLEREDIDIIDASEEFYELTERENDRVLNEILLHYAKGHELSDFIGQMAMAIKKDVQKVYINHMFLGGGN